MYRRISIKIVSIVKSRFQTLNVGSLVRSTCSANVNQVYVWPENASSLPFLSAGLRKED